MSSLFLKYSASIFMKFGIRRVYFWYTRYIPMVYTPYTKYDELSHN